MKQTYLWAFCAACWFALWMLEAFTGDHEGRFQALTLMLLSILLMKQADSLGE